jgi:hypothetical protein
MKSSVVWNITPRNPLKVNRHYGGTCRLCFLSVSCWFDAWLILRPRRWRRHVPPKRQLTFNGLSSRTIALGSTQLLIEISTRNLSGGDGRPARKADNLTAICELIVYKMWAPRRLTNLWAFMACYRGSFTFYPCNSPPFTPRKIPGTQFS